MTDKIENDCDPLDTPLPCEITIGATTFGKGVALRALVNKARRDCELIRSNMAQKDIAQAAVFAKKYDSSRKPDDLEAMRRMADRAHDALHQLLAEHINIGSPAAEIAKRGLYGDTLAADKREGS